MLRLMMLLLFVASGAMDAHANAQSRIDDQRVRETVRRTVRQLRSRLDVRVYEPIPTKIATVRELSEALTKSFTPRRNPEAPPPTTAKPQPPEAAAARARETARALAGHYVARYVRRGKSETLFIMPENVTKILPAGEVNRASTNRLLRFEIARELTRMADSERIRFKAAQGTTLTNAGRALIEARAWWAARQLVGDVRTRPTLKDVPAADAELISVFMGEGVARATRLLERRLTAGGPKALAALLDAPPQKWSDLPSLDDKPEAAPNTPALRAVAALAKVFPETGWTAATTSRDRTAIRSELGDALSPSSARKLAGRMVESHRHTIQHRTLGMVTVTITEMQSGSAAFAYLMGMQRVVNARRKRIESDGAPIEILARRTRDLAAFPVLQTVRSRMGQGPAMMRASGVTGPFYIEIVGPAEVTDWYRVRDALRKMRAALNGQAPG